MNCRECIDRLDQLVDRELSPLEAAEVQMHLEDCLECTERFHFEEGMRRLVRTCCSSDHAPETLRHRLRQILNS